MHVQGTKAAGGPLHSGGGEVCVASNLILRLELVGVVSTGRDGAASSQDAILPRVLPLLDAVPCQEERLVEVVDDVDDEVVIGDAVETGAGELAVDEDSLLWYAEWGDGAVGDGPGEVEVGVVGAGDGEEGQN